MQVDNVSMTRIVLDSEDEAVEEEFAQPAACSDAAVTSADKPELTITLEPPAVVTVDVASTTDSSDDIGRHIQSAHSALFLDTPSNSKKRTASNSTPPASSQGKRNKLKRSKTCSEENEVGEKPGKLKRCKTIKTYRSTPSHNTSVSIFDDLGALSQESYENVNTAYTAILKRGIRKSWREDRESGTQSEQSTSIIIADEHIPRETRERPNALPDPEKVYPLQSTASHDFTENHQREVVGDVSSTIADTVSNNSQCNATEVWSGRDGFISDEFPRPEGQRLTPSTINQSMQTVVTRVSENRDGFEDDCELQVLSQAISRRKGQSTDSRFSSELATISPIDSHSNANSQYQTGSYPGNTDLPQGSDKIRATGSMVGKWATPVATKVPARKVRRCRTIATSVLDNRVLVEKDSLIEMGFRASQADTAIRETDGNLTTAVEYLVNQEKTPIVDSNQPSLSGSVATPNTKQRMNVIATNPIDLGNTTHNLSNDDQRSEFEVDADVDKPISAADLPVESHRVREVEPERAQPVGKPNKRGRGRPRKIQQPTKEVDNIISSAILDEPQADMPETIPEVPVEETLGKRKNNRRSKSRTKNVTEERDDGQATSILQEPKASRGGREAALLELEPNAFANRRISMLPEITLDVTTEPAGDGEQTSEAWRLSASDIKNSPQKPLQSPEKPHSPLNKGHVPFKVGLSKRARIQPLLRIVRK